MIHPYTELRFINNEIGYGVVATKLIPKGTITWALDKLDRIMAPNDIEQMHPLCKDILSKYTFRDSNGNYVLCWDNGRFVNHSFNSNCLTTAYNFELAIRDIQPGEELTDDYGYLNLNEPFEALPEKGTNRKIAYPDDLVRFYKVWDEKLNNAVVNFNKVDQPLIDLLSGDLQKKVAKIANGREQMDSILNCYYKAEGELSSVNGTSQNH